MDQDKSDPEYIQNVPFNPLADYSLQTKGKPLKTIKRLGETTLVDDFRLGLTPLTEDTLIGMYDDTGNLNHMKVMDAAANRDLLLSLDPTTLSLFIWILFKIAYRDETVEIRYELVNAKGLKERTFDKAIKQLEANNIIKRIGTKGSGEYWLFHINPQVMWKGNALKYYKEVVKLHPEYKTQSTPKK